MLMIYIIAGICPVASLVNLFVDIDFIELINGILVSLLCV